MLTNGLRKLVLGVLFTATLGVLLTATLLSLLLRRGLAVESLLLVAISVGLLSYSLTAIVGLSPWSDVGRSVRLMRDRGREGREGRDERDRDR